MLGHEKRWLMEHARQRFPTSSRRQNEFLKHLIWARTRRKVPLQYLLGSQPFGHADIKCRAPVLIPRFDTEAWVMRLAEQWRGQRGAIVDLCTGTGCIAIELALSLPGIHCLGVDISKKAVRLARENAIRNKVADRVQFAPYDVLNDTAPLFDRFFQAHHGARHLVANPPYILATEMSTLPRDVALFEDDRALIGTERHRNVDGWRYYHVILGLGERLKANSVTMEIGTQSLAEAPVSSLYHRALWRDDQQHPRVLHYTLK